MGFKNMKRDDHGHVISNNEVDGQKCQHQNGGSGNKNWQKKDTPGADVYEREVNGEKHIALKSKNDGSIHYFKGNTAKTEEVDGFEDSPFDDDYEEEFREPSPEDEKQYVDKCMADIAKAADKNAFEYVGSNIDDLTEAGLISDETSDRLMDALNRKIDEVNSDIDKDLMDAVNAADDVLDEQFGKDTPERKLAGAIKNSKEMKKPDNVISVKPEDLENKGPKNAPSGGGDEPPDDEFLKDIGTEVKASQFGRPETLDEYFERVKDIHANDDEEELNDWTYFVSQAFGIGKKNAKRYLDLKLKSLPKKSENLDGSQGLDKLGISQGFGKRISKNQFEQYVKLSDEDKQKLRKQGYLQNYHGYDIEEVDGKDEYRIWKLGK